MNLCVLLDTMLYKNTFYDYPLLRAAEIISVSMGSVLNIVIVICDSVKNCIEHVVCY